MKRTFGFRVWLLTLTSYDDIDSERRLCPVVEALCVTAIDRLQNVIREAQAI